MFDVLCHLERGLDWHRRCRLKLPGDARFFTELVAPCKSARLHERNYSFVSCSDRKGYIQHSTWE